MWTRIWCVSLVSCGDDEEKDNGLVGWYQQTPYYIPEMHVSYFDAIHIINGNTMEYYEGLTNGYYKGDGRYPACTEPFPYKSGWYCNHDFYHSSVITFVVSENKLITKGGSIYTIIGNKLIAEGKGDVSDLTYTKIN